MYTLTSIALPCNKQFLGYKLRKDQVKLLSEQLGIKTMFKCG